MSGNRHTLSGAAHTLPAWVDPCSGGFVSKVHKHLTISKAEKTADGHLRVELSDGSSCKVTLDELLSVGVFQVVDRSFYVYGKTTRTSGRVAEA